MKNIEIRGETRYFDTINATLSFYIVADTAQNIIEIFGCSFESSDLKILNDFIAHHKKHTNKVITLRFKQYEDPTFSSMSPYFFSRQDFPVLDINIQWIKKIFIKESDFYKTNRHSNLGKTLSNLKEFSFMIERTNWEPEFIADFEKGEIKITGRSTSYFPYETFYPLAIWIEDYITKGKNIKEVIFELEYFNTASSKAIMELLKILKKHIDSIDQITWYHLDDEDMEEAGNEYYNIVGLHNKMRVLEKK